jgi:hypothetical protein
MSLGRSEGVRHLTPRPRGAYHSLPRRCGVEAFPSDATRFIPFHSGAVRISDISLGRGAGLGPSFRCSEAHRICSRGGVGLQHSLQVR